MIAIQRHAIQVPDRGMESRSETKRTDYMDTECVRGVIWALVISRANSL